MSDTTEKPAEAPAVFQRPADIVIAWKDRSDTALYRAAKAEAERLGVRVVWEAEPPQVFTPGPNDLVVSKDISPAEYRAAKARAEAAGKTIVFAPRA